MAYRSNSLLGLGTGSGVKGRDYSYKSIAKKPVSNHTGSKKTPKKKTIPSSSRFSSKSSSKSKSSYNYTPNTASKPLPKAATYSGGGSKSSIDSWISKLKKEINGSPQGPKLPAQINLDRYKTEIATIQDIAKKYGFDYSKDYAQKQAEALAQAQRDEIATSRERLEHETESAKEDLSHDFFNRYLQQRQDLADTGLNAGIASERNIRLDMNRQNALAEILSNTQLRNQELDRNLSTIEKERIAYADKLYNERLQQGFGNAMDYTSQQRQENQAMLNAALQQREQVVDEAWKKFEWNNMSASEKAKLVADAEKFGMEMAWERHKFDAGLEFQAGYGNFSSAGGGGGSQYPATSYQTTKGTPPSSFRNHLSQAIQRTGVSSSWVQPLSQLVANESSWNPSAKNPNSTAHGYAQFLNSTRRNYEKKMGISYNNPVNQLIMMIQYVKDRYGSAQNALNFWNQKKWY